MILLELHNLQERQGCQQKVLITLKILKTEKNDHRLVFFLTIRVKGLFCYK